MKALCIGQSTYDISTILDEYPVENKKYNASEKLESGGGEASNAACTLSKWGVETYLSTALGSDTYSDKIKKEFEMFGIKPDFIETNFDKDTSLEFVFINKKNGSRTVFGMTSQDRVPYVKKTELEIEPDIILMDGYEYQASTRALNRFPNVTSIMDATNFTGEVVELSKYCKYILASQDFVENLTKIKADFANPTTLLTVYNETKTRFPRNDVVIVLDNNAVIYSVNNEIKVMPALKVEIKDRTGAKDIFHGAFAYGVINKLDFEKSLRYAVIASSLSCTNYGGRLAVPPLNTVIEYYNQKFGSVAVNAPV